MALYLLLLFLHVLGAVGMFGAWTVDILATGQILRATGATQVRAAVALRRGSAPIGFVSMLLAIVTGVWMMILRWGPEPWIVTGISELLLIIVVGIAFERRTLPPLRALLADEGERLPSSIASVGAALTASLILRITAAVAILALMTVKPGLTGSLVIVGAAIALGLGGALGSSRRWSSIPRLT